MKNDPIALVEQLMQSFNTIYSIQDAILCP